MTTEAETTRFLPRHMYPDNLSEKALDGVDKTLRERQDSIPTAPGQYTDKTGSIWTLDDQNQWTDASGETRTVEYTPLVCLFGPFTPC